MTVLLPFSVFAEDFPYETMNSYTYDYLCEGVISPDCYTVEKISSKNIIESLKSNSDYLGSVNLVTFHELIDNYLNDKNKLFEMGANARKLGVLDVEDRIYVEIKKLLKGKM